MPDILLPIVYVVFTSQILVISFLLSNKWRQNRSQLFEKYPQAEYPKLYCQPVDVEYLRLWIRKYLDLAIGLIGILLIVYSLFSAFSATQVADIMFAFAIVQFLPLVLSNIWGIKNRRLMKQIVPPTKRKTTLIARRLSDFISPLYLSITVLMYLITLTIGGYIYIENLWQNKTWGLVALLALNTLITLFIFWLIYNNIYGKPKDHHINYADRIKRMGFITSKLATLNITYCFFVISLFITKSFDLGVVVVYLLTSIYLQLVLSINSCKTPNRDFSVYKMEPSDPAAR